MGNQTQTNCCPQWEDVLIDSFSGDLNYEQSQALGLHLIDCQACRSYLDDLNLVQDALNDDVPQIEAPSQLKQNIMAQIEQEKPKLKWFTNINISPNYKGAFAAAAVILVAGFSFVIIENNNSEELQKDSIPGLSSDKNIQANLQQGGDEGILTVNHLPSISDEYVYQAWVQKGGELYPSTVFIPDENKTTAVAIPKGLNNAEQVLVTREYGQGSEEPTSEPLLTVNL